jgi:hypothetical protein
MALMNDPSPSLEILRLLISMGADVSVANPFTGDNSLHVISSKRFVATKSLFLLYTATPSATKAQEMKNNDGKTPAQVRFSLPPSHGFLFLCTSSEMTLLQVLRSVNPQSTFHTQLLIFTHSPSLTPAITSFLTFTLPVFLYLYIRSIESLLVIFPLALFFYPTYLLSLPPTSSQFFLGAAFAILVDIFITYLLYLDPLLPPFLFWLPYLLLITIVLSASLTIAYAPSRRSMGQWTSLSLNTLTNSSSSRSSTHDSSSRQYLLSKLTGDTSTEISSLINSRAEDDDSSLDLCPTCILDKALTSTHCSVRLPFFPTCLPPPPFSFSP